MRLLLAFVAVLLSFSAGATDSLIVYTWGGAYEQAQRETAFKPFSREFGIPIVTATANNLLAKVKAETEQGRSSLDIADMNVAQAINGCDEGLLRRVGRLFNPDDYVPGAVFPCGVAQNIWAQAIIVRPDETSIRSAKDFFDPSIPGKRGLRKWPRVTLEMALLGAGVPKDHIYDVLKTDAGLQLAFDTIRGIKDRIIWWGLGAQSAKLIANREVVASTGFTGRILNLRKNEGLRDTKILWNAHERGFSVWTIPKNNPHPKLALQLLRFATGPRNLRMNDVSAYASVRAHQANTNPDLPTYPANMRQGIAEDGEFWAEYGPEISRKFSAFLSGL